MIFMVAIVQIDDCYHKDHQIIEVFLVLHIFRIAISFPIISKILPFQKSVVCFMKDQIFRTLFVDKINKSCITYSIAIQPNL